MTVTSFYFLMFLLIGVCLYYVVPSKVQWVVLLLLSIIFYVKAYAFTYSNHLSATFPHVASRKPRRY